ncbi:hypothetical protein BC827DRAFT_1121818 [Russula dissimulans]|nr:hypothetical protein BC827DRAFT_1121818 [Russula dissimulans]
MLLSSLPRRVAFPSSCPSCCWSRITRFATTVSAFEKRIHGGVGNIPNISQPVSSQRTIGHDIDTAGRALGPSKTESYLSSLFTDGATPTLQDLERLKPSEHSVPQSKKYAHEYLTLLNTICRSFSHDQLRSFSQQYGLHIGSNQRKMSVAEAIVEKAWRWPSLKELKRAQRDRTEVTSRTLAITSSELFILLGKDGSDLFQLSKTYNVHISVKSNPLSLYFEGSRESVREMEKYVGNGIVEDTIDTPFSHAVPQEVLQKISRLSGAFVENLENQKVRKTFKLGAQSDTTLSYVFAPNTLRILC